jgi:hypothetical protein
MPSRDRRSSGMRLSDHVSKRTEAIVGIAGASALFLLGVVGVLIHMTPASSIASAGVLAWCGWLACSSVALLRDR